MSCRRLWVSVLLAVNCTLLAYLVWNRPSPPLPDGPRAPDPNANGGRRLQEHGRPVYVGSRYLQLGDTGFRAAVGPVTYREPPGQRPSFYQLAVELPFGPTVSDGWRVMFQRDLWIGEVPETLIHAAAEEIVAFDPATRTVTFNVG